MDNIIKAYPSLNVCLIFPQLICSKARHPYRTQCRPWIKKIYKKSKKEEKFNRSRMALKVDRTTWPFLKIDKCDMEPIDMRINIIVMT